LNEVCFAGRLKIITRDLLEVNDCCVAAKGKKRLVLRWPTFIVLQAIALRAERSGPRHADSESKLS